jgi:tetratricopeptide (TPR) repeat protein
MQYAVTLMNRGDYADGLPYLERSMALSPYDYLPEMNLAVAYAALGRDAEAVPHFLHAMKLGRDLWDPHYYYGRWLKDKGRLAESQAELETAVRLNTRAFAARYLLMELYTQQGNWQALDALIPETFRLSNNDEIAQRYMAERENRLKQAAASGTTAPPPAASSETPEAVLQSAVDAGRAKRYEDCVTLAKKALALRPGYAEAYHTMAVAYVAMHRLDEGIQAASEAVRLKPDFELARKNLERAQAMKRAETGGR